MVEGFRETREKVRQYYDKVGTLNIDPFDIPESPDEIELYVGWFFDRIRSIVAVENHYQKFKSVEETLVLLEAASEDLGLNIMFFYMPETGQWGIDFTNPEDYLNLPHVAHYFAKMYRFKPAPNRLYGEQRTDPHDVGWDVYLNDGEEEDMR